MTIFHMFFILVPTRLITVCPSLARGAQQRSGRHAMTHFARLKHGHTRRSSIHCFFRQCIACVISANEHGTSDDIRIRFVWLLLQGDNLVPTKFRGITFTNGTGKRARQSIPYFCDMRLHVDAHHVHEKGGGNANIVNSSR